MRFCLYTEILGRSHLGVWKFWAMSSVPPSGSSLCYYKETNHFLRIAPDYCTYDAAIMTSHVLCLASPKRQTPNPFAGNY
jgi:hypothetical protein